MATITVDFDVFKALTNMRATESMTENDVLRGLLGLDAKESGRADTPVHPVKDREGTAVFKGVTLPNGTQFRSTYKGRTYTAEISNGVWTDSEGNTRNSPSEAAVKITGKPWNGWRFWHCKLPGTKEWVLLDTLR